MLATQIDAHALGLVNGGDDEYGGSGSANDTGYDSSGGGYADDGGTSVDGGSTNDDPRVASALDGYSTDDQQVKDVIANDSGYDPSRSSMSAAIDNARANDDKAMEHARQYVETRDDVNYAPEVREQKAREYLESQPRLETARPEPDYKGNIEKVHERVTKPWEHFNDIMSTHDPSNPRPNVPTPPRIGGARLGR